MNNGFNYGKYLASREWALLKNAVRERSHGICERCNNAPYQETHHLTYERIGNELLGDLMAVCKPCHEYLSAKRDDDPAMTQDPDEKLLKMRANFIQSLCESGCIREEELNTDNMITFLARVERMSREEIIYMSLWKLGKESRYGKNVTHPWKWDIDT